MAKKNELETADIQKDKPEIPEAHKAPEAKKSRFTIYEVWRLEKKIENGKISYPRLKKVKETKILPEHAQILNTQSENSLTEYVKKG